MGKISLSTMKTFRSTLLVGMLCLSIALGVLADEPARTTSVATSDGMPRFAERVKRAKTDAAWAPEPCYPPPCPGYNYGKVSLMSDTQQQNPDVGMVPAEHFGEGPAMMGALGPPPMSPAVVVAEEEAEQGLQSVVNLPPPPFSFPLGDEECPECDTNTDDAEVRQQMIEAQERAKKIDARISKKELLLIDHDRWISKAQEVVNQVQELIKQSHASKQAVNLQIARLKIRKQEVQREAQKAQLESGLQDAQTALAELGERQEVLKATREIIQTSREKVNNRLSELAKKVGIEGTAEHVEQKLREWAASTDPLARQLNKMWKDYPHHPARDKPNTGKNNGKQPAGGNN